MSENKVLQESSWNQFAIGNNRQRDNGAYSMTQTDMSNGWYTQQLDVGGTRYQRLLNYEQADSCSILISRALDILAEDISSSNADDNQSIVIEFPDDSKVTKTTIKVTHDYLDNWAERSSMERDLYIRVRNTLKYGITLYHRMSDGSLREIPTEQIVGYILDKRDRETVTHYLIDPSVEPLPCNGKIINKDTRLLKQMGEAKIIKFDIDDLVVMKFGKSPLGTSIIDRVYKTWRKMSMIEDAVLIYRVVRAPERRVYYVDTGRLTGAKREAAVESQRLRLAQSRSVKKNGDVTTVYDPQSLGEDIFIATNSNGRGSRVETLQGGGNLGELNDLEWFSKQLAAGLRIPHSMIDPQSEDQNNFSDMRVGQHYQVEMRYMGYVKRFQRQLQDILRKEFERYCSLRDFEIHDDAELVIQESMSFHKYKEMELDQTMLNIYNSTSQATSLSKKFAIQRYMGLSLEEIRTNEEMRLMELGITPDVIKKMEQVDIDNIVYGDARLGKNYGISPNDDVGY